MSQGPPEGRRDRSEETAGTYDQPNPEKRVLYRVWTYSHDIEGQEDPDEIEGEIVTVLGKTDEEEVPPAGGHGVNLITYSIEKKSLWPTDLRSVARVRLVCYHYNVFSITMRRVEF
jgi:hypothetical protein